MNPGSHGELCDEDVATLGKKDRGLSRDHLDLWICLHDLLYPSKRQLVKLVVMSVALEMVDGVLPIRCQDILVLACESLVHLITS